MPNLGTVKFFDSRETKRFGFLKLDDGTEIFFHFNDGQIIRAGGQVPEFTGKSTVVVDGRPRGLRDPRLDDKIVFFRTSGTRGDKASPWGFQSQWLAAEATITKRPFYRVLELMTSTGQTPGEPKALWTGSDMSDLLRKFPVPSGNRSPGSDPLLSYYADSDNIFEIRRWWEIRRDDGSWERCNDPRPLTGVLRTFEAINRR